MTMNRHTSLYIPEKFRKRYEQFVKMVGPRKVSQVIRDLITAYIQTQER